MSSIKVCAQWNFVDTSIDLTPDQSHMHSKRQGDVGIIVRFRDDTKTFVIVKVTENSPAAKSGEVRENDLILAIAGKPVQGLTLADVTTLLDGPVESFVRLKLQRDEVSFDCRLCRGDPNDWKSKKDVKRTIQVKETVKAPEKLSDRARAERLANGDQFKAVNRRVRDKDPGKFSPRSLEAERARVLKEHETAQRKADKLYAENVARDEEERKGHTDALLDTVCGKAPPPESWWQRKRRETATWWQDKRRDMFAYLAINLVEHKIAKAQASASTFYNCPFSPCCAEARKTKRV